MTRNILLEFSSNITDFKTKCKDDIRDQMGSDEETDLDSHFDDRIEHNFAIYSRKNYLNLRVFHKFFWRKWPEELPRTSLCLFTVSIMCRNATEFLCWSVDEVCFLSMCCDE